MSSIVTYAHRYKRPPRHQLMVWGACSVIGLAVVAGPVLAAGTFDGTYTGKRVLVKGPDAQCPSSEDASATIDGGVLTFTNSALHNFSVGFDPRKDGSFGEVSTIGGASVSIEGHIVGDVLDADVTNGPCEHHWHLSRSK
jgi:hypothetical protein